MAVGATAASRASPASAYDALRVAVLRETSLDALTGMFAAAIAEDGIAGHVCGLAEGATRTPLFGDQPALILSDDGHDIHREADDVVLRLASIPAAPAVARVKGFALLYVARGRALRVQAGVALSACGLSVCQRFILGQLLVGNRPLDIALRMGRSVGSVQDSIRRATAKLGVSRRDEAVAIAARRGWLFAPAPQFRPLSPEEIDYYS